MHMADALISPIVGGAMWATSVGMAVYSAKKLKTELAERKVPLMGVLGAFIFAAQMINFTIPMTGSSGHLGGGMILAILLGPHAAFLVMFSILTVQALFFADGGLLALGCNVFNLGFWPCFFVYPLIFRKIVGDKVGQGRILAGSITAGVIGLQLGALSVVFQTLFSGISELPFGSFLLLMQPIHLAIGIVEGVVTAALVSFVWKARPEIMDFSSQSGMIAKISIKPLLIMLVVATIITGGALSWFASEHPDGLEWSMSKTSGKEEMQSPKDGIHASMAELQNKTAFLPGYDFKQTEEVPNGKPTSAGEAASEIEKVEAKHWPAVSAGTSVSGLVGGAIVLVLLGLVGISLRFMRRKDE